MTRPEKSIPLVDLSAQYVRHRDELDAAVGAIIRDSSFIGGREHTAFAREFAAFCGDGHAVLVGNGTDALTLAIIEILGQGDGSGEILTTSHTFVATAEAIINAGYRPTFADIDQDSGLISPDAVERAITPASRALMPVHLYGQMADMRALRRIADAHKLAIIEDAAQAHGALRDGVAPGELSDAACFSFYPGKNLGAWGDGGAIFTRSAELAEGLTRRANHGRRGKYLHESIGVNSRMDNLQAAVLRVKLPHLTAWNDARRQAAGWYDELLGNQPGIRLPVTEPGALHVYHLYVIQVDNRDEIRRRLNEQGIGAGVHYPVPVHEQPAFAFLGYAAHDFRVTSRVAQRVLSLPIYPEIERDQVERVGSALIEAVRS